MKQDGLDRRTFLGTVPAAVVLAATSARRLAATLGSPAPPLRAAARPPGTIGLQLYTLRALLAEALAPTLAAVAQMGYREVELAGLHGLSPRAMRERLDDVGLVAVSSHHGLEEVRGSWERILDGAVELGQSLVVVPSIPGAERNLEGLRRVADDLTRAGEAARGRGLRLGYHNHDWELAPLPDGFRPIDVLLERTDPALVDWQMDVFWVVHGGGDPAAYLRARGARVTSVHVKDRTADGRMVDVGDGIIDFRALLTLAERGGLRHAFVEHDDPDEPLTSARRSLAHLRTVLETGGRGPTKASAG